MLLAKGGRTVYLGPVDDVEEYFASMKILVPDRINPPDHFMDVLEGIAKPDGNPDFDPKVLPLKWIQHNKYPIPDDLQALASSLDKSSKSRNEEHEVSRIIGSRNSFRQELWQEFTSFWEVKWDDFRSIFSHTEDFSQRRTLGFFSQLKLIISR